MMSFSNYENISLQTQFNWELNIHGKQVNAYATYSLHIQTILKCCKVCVKSLEEPTDIEFIIL